MWKIISTKIVLRDEGKPSMRVYWEVNNHLGITDLIHDSNFPYGKVSSTDILSKVQEILSSEKTAILEKRE